MSHVYWEEEITWGRGRIAILLCSSSTLNRETKCDSPNLLRVFSCSAFPPKNIPKEGTSTCAVFIFLCLPPISCQLLCPSLGEMGLYFMASSTFNGCYMACIQLEPSQVAVSLPRNTDFIKGLRSQGTPMLLPLLPLICEIRGVLCCPPQALCNLFPCCCRQDLHPEEQSSLLYVCAKLSTVTAPSWGLNAPLQYG